MNRRFNRFASSSTENFNLGLEALLKNPSIIGEAASKDDEAPYDLFVIGGGSGGLAAAKQAAQMGAKVGLADYVPPSPAGSTWGLGGTCVNVGCIPKKLLHHAAQLGEAAQDAAVFGWNTGATLPPSTGHGPIAGGLSLDWDRLVAAVSDVRRSSNWMYKSALWDEGVVYENAFAALGTQAGSVDLWKQPPSPPALAVQGRGGGIHSVAPPIHQCTPSGCYLPLGRAPAACWTHRGHSWTHNALHRTMCGRCSSSLSVLSSLVPGTLPLRLQDFWLG